MADLQEFTDVVAVLDGAAAPTTDNSINFNTEWQKADRRTSGKLTPEARCVMGKKPAFSLSILDPSVILPTGFKATTNAKAIYRKYERDGGLGAGYKSLTFAKALIVPKSLSVSEGEPAILEVQVLGLYDGGSCVAFGTESQAPANITKCFVIKSVVIGGTTITDIENISVNWNFDLVPRPVFEPETYYFKTFNLSGSIALRDLDEVDINNSVDGKKETVVINLVDRESALNTLQLDMGTCDVEAGIQGGKMSYNFTSL